MTRLPDKKEPALRQRVGIARRARNLISGIRLGRLGTSVALGQQDPQPAKLVFRQPAIGNSMHATTCNLCGRHIVQELFNPTKFCHCQPQQAPVPAGELVGEIPRYEFLSY